MQITKGKVARAQKAVVYGPEGIGKSTFAAQFPDPLFIDTEGSTYHMDVARTPKPSSWTMLMEQVKHVKNNPHICKTLVIDTADWAEQLCVSEVCSKAQKASIEDFGYGKGYAYLAEEFGRLLNLLEEVIIAGVHVVFTAHAQMRKFDQPEESGSYDRWEVKLQKKTAPLLKEWADMILFANYKTFVVNVDGQGAAKGKNKAQGGKRVMYTSHHPCWDAKNRHDLPNELPFDYKEVAHCFTSVSSVQTKLQPKSEEQASVEKPVEQPEEQKISENNNQEEDGPLAAFATNEDYSKVPKKLADLMSCNEVTVFEIQTIVADKGYYPLTTPIDKYDTNFVDGVLVGAWDKVFQAVLKSRDDLPF